MIREKKRDMCKMHGYTSQPNTSMKTHLLKHRHDKRREKRCSGYSQPNTYKQFSEFKTHLLKHTDMIRGKTRDMWWLLIAYNTQNNSMNSKLTS